MEYVIIAILAICLVILLAKYLLIKNELKKASARLSKDLSRALPVEMVDPDLNELIIQINRMYEALLEVRNEGNESEKALRNAISVVSHDMKTPLTSVIGYLQLSKNAQGEEVQQYIDIALERADYLNELVNDFFEVSLIDSDRYAVQLEEINICELILEEIFALAPSFDKRGIRPVFENAEEDIRLMVDRKMFRRIIQNLLGNCVKYAEERIEVQVEHKDADFVTIRFISGCSAVIDTDRIFDKFYREDEARSGEGAGLGMYICRKFTDLMGGELTARQEGKTLIVEGRFPAVCCSV